MINKVYVDFFKSNNPDLKVEDIISNVRIGTTPEGVIILSFNTTDKYVDVDNSLYVHGQGYKGCGIKINPHIFDEETDEYICASECYLPSVSNEKVDQYYENPKFYDLTLVVDGTGDHVSVISALKHEYRVLFVPFDIAYNSECLLDTELVYVERPKVDSGPL